jgi:hypothetical protein
MHWKVRFSQSPKVELIADRTRRREVVERHRAGSLSLCHYPILDVADAFDLDADDVSYR